MTETFVNKRGTPVFSYTRMSSSGVHDIYYGVVLLSPVCVCKEEVELFTNNRKISERHLPIGTNIFSIAFVYSSANFIVTVDMDDINWMASRDTIDSILKVSDELYSINEKTDRYDEEQSWSFTILNSSGSQGSV